MVQYKIVFMKNLQTPETIRQMVKLGMGSSAIKSCVELTAGCCNAAYLITQKNRKKSILKIASEDSSYRMRNESCLMENEIAAMNLVRGKIDYKVPEIYFYDDSQTVCSGKYFFMEVLPGTDYWSLQDKLTPGEKTALNFTIGDIVHEISKIEGEYFGFLGDEKARFKTLYELVYYMLNNILSDSDDKSIDYSISKEDLLGLLEKDKPCFEVNFAPGLVHYDLWEGNVFIKNKKISGIIDWERALFGDPLMEDRFRLQKCTPAFLDGYRQSQFNYKETRRLLWYDVLLYLSMMNEGSFRNYKDDSTYNFAAPLFNTSLDMLKLSL